MHLKSKLLCLLTVRVCSISLFMFSVCLQVNAVQLQRNVLFIKRFQLPVGKKRYTARHVLNCYTPGKIKHLMCYFYQSAITGKQVSWRDASWNDGVPR